MAKGIDYSKWDRMDFSDDSDDDDNNTPRVTSLEEPGRVTLRPDGSVEIATNVSDEKKSLAAGASAPFTAVMPSMSNNEEFNKKNTKIQQWQEQLIHNGGEHYCMVNIDPDKISSKEENCTMAKNEVATTLNTGKSIKLPIYWSQDRYTATLRMGFPPTLFPSRTIRVRVTGALEYSDRSSAVGSGRGESSSYGTIEIVSVLENSKDNRNEKKKIVLLKGKLPRPIHLFQDEKEIGFEIEDNVGIETISDEQVCTKLVCIALPKAVPMEGMITWWDCVMNGFPQIDVAEIKDRNVSLTEIAAAAGVEGGSDEAESSKKEVFQKAWEDAHVIFREKMKNKEVKYLDVDE